MMNERLIQWTLLREWDYLQECLRLPLLHRYGENIATEHGILDFAVLAKNGDLVVVELETGISSHAKFLHVEEQLTRYKRITFQGKQTQLALLFAEDDTPERLRDKIHFICEKLSIKECTYKLTEVHDRYQRLVTQLAKNIGIPLGPTTAMDVCYLRWMNTLIKPFADQHVNELPISFSFFFEPSGRGLFRRRTTYGVRKRLCEDFELLLERGNKLVLTEYGQRFAEAMLPDILVGFSKTHPLSAEQKRILLEVLTNGVMRPCKANIYYFLRFIYLTEGAWVPKSTAPEPKPEQQDFSYWELATALLGKRYSWRTLTDFLSFTCNQCEELDLVERVKLSGAYDHVVLTLLGSRIIGLFELDLHLKRERIHIPLQVM